MYSESDGKTNPRNDQWLKVKDASGMEGYVAAWFVALNETDGKLIMETKTTKPATILEFGWLSPPPLRRLSLAGRN